MSSYTHHLGTSFFGQVLFKQKKGTGCFHAGWIGIFKLPDPWSRKLTGD